MRLQTICLSVFSFDCCSVRPCVKDGQWILVIFGQLGKYLEDCLFLLSLLGGGSLDELRIAFAMLLDF